ncbi:MAG: beta-Ala-His dipeptidase [Candidatus Lokiarchaeota archaeon]|nr:beta-Ala-His dipeptidase [Candidatus Lokiarchaeota archaeon]
MLKLHDLGQPIEFWDYFEQISKIPRCSQHEEKIRNFIQGEGKKLGFKTKVDEIGNLAISIPAKSVEKEKLILQCHMDMVCEKNNDVVHDFSNDPLKLKIIEIENKKWLTAEGTTLGADNGTGICFNLSLMKKIHDGSMKFDSLSLELLFTVLEEFNLGGAKNIDKSLVNGDMLINLDSGGEGRITNGCTGGIGFIADIKTKPVSVETLEGNFIPHQLTLSGLIGGHSGGDITRGRGNANKLLCHILWKLHQNYSIYINSINGGNAANAITREAYSILFLKEGEFSEIRSYINSLFIELKKNYEGIEENMRFSIEEVDTGDIDTVFSKDIQGTLLDLLYIIPSGPLSTHPKIRVFALASTNIGIIKTEKDYIRIRMLHRSFSKYYNENTCEQIITLLQMSGLDMERKITGGYPPWEPKFDSKLLKVAKKTYMKLFKQEASIIMIQGGLEPTFLINLNPKMEAIAIGPTASNVHSPNERLYVDSVENTWKFLTNILKKLD